MYKLLLVDDETIIRDGIIKMVDWDRLDIIVTASCANAFAALDSMMDDMPDILMTDVRMPGMNGLELIERACSLHPHLHTIILSGYNDFDYARQAMKYGVKEYLLKPCASEEMEQALARTCREVDKYRSHVLQLSGERQEQVRSLIEKTNELRTGTLDADALTHQAGELAKAVHDPSVMREALFRMLTNDAPPNWSINVIQNVLTQPDQLIPQFVNTIQRLREESGGDQRGIVRKMTAYTEEHYGDETLSLQYIADNVVFMSADYIGRKFAKSTGERFSNYLVRVRMEQAKKLLRSDPSIRSYEIAEKIGLGNNPHYFSLVFRKYTGMTPTEYRAKMDNMTEK